jgi:hypothetical protein
VLSLTMLAALAAPPAFVAADVPEARLAGEGEYTWFGMRIYQAQLWVGRKATRARRPQRRRSCWNCATRALDGRKIAEASYEQMQKLGVGTPAAPGVAGYHAAHLSRM